VFTVSRRDVVLNGHNCRKLSDRRHLYNPLLLTQISYVYVSVCVCMQLCVCVCVCVYVCFFIKFY
jgi:hypothetical protein